MSGDFVKVECPHCFVKTDVGALTCASCDKDFGGIVLGKSQGISGVIFLMALSAGATFFIEKHNLTAEHHVIESKQVVRYEQAVEYALATACITGAATNPISFDDNRQLCFCAVSNMPMFITHSEFANSSNDKIAEAFRASFAQCNNTKPNRYRDESPY